MPSGKDLSLCAANPYSLGINTLTCKGCMSQLNFLCQSQTKLALQLSKYDTELQHGSW